MIPKDELDLPMSADQTAYVEYGEDGVGRTTYRWVILTKWAVIPSA